MHDAATSIRVFWSNIFILSILLVSVSSPKINVMEKIPREILSFRHYLAEAVFL